MIVALRNDCAVINLKLTFPFMLPGRFTVLLQASLIVVIRALLYQLAQYALRLAGLAIKTCPSDPSDQRGAEIHPHARLHSWGQRPVT